MGEASNPKAPYAAKTLGAAIGINWTRPISNRSLTRASSLRKLADQALKIDEVA